MSDPQSRQPSIAAEDGCLHPCPCPPVAAGGEGFFFRSSAQNGCRLPFRGGVLSLVTAGPGLWHAAAHPPHQRTCNFPSTVHFVFFRLPAKGRCLPKRPGRDHQASRWRYFNEPRLCCRIVYAPAAFIPTDGLFVLSLQHFLPGLDALTPPSPRLIPHLSLPLLASYRPPAPVRLSCTSNLKAHLPPARPPTSLPTAKWQLLLYLTLPSSFHQPTSLVSLSAVSTVARSRRLPVCPHTRRGSLKHSHPSPCIQRGHRLCDSPTPPERFKSSRPLQQHCRHSTEPNTWRRRAC